MISYFFNCTLVHLYIFVHCFNAFFLLVLSEVATLKFRLTLLNKTFHQDLTDKRTELFINLASNVTHQVQNLFIVAGMQAYVRDGERKGWEVEGGVG